MIGIARRKAAMDLHLMVSSPWAALLLTEIALLVWLYRQRMRASNAEGMLSKAGFAAFAAAGAALLLFNDAGVLGASVCLLFAVPAALVGFRRREE